MVEPAVANCQKTVLRERLEENDRMVSALGGLSKPRGAFNFFKSGAARQKLIHLPCLPVDRTNSPAQLLYEIHPIHSDIIRGFKENEIRYVAKCRKIYLLQCQTPFVQS